MRVTSRVGGAALGLAGSLKSSSWSRAARLFEFQALEVATAVDLEAADLVAALVDGFVGEFFDGLEGVEDVVVDVADVDGVAVAEGGLVEVAVGPDVVLAAAFAVFE